MIQGRRSESGYQEPATRPIDLHSRARVRWLGKVTERIYLFNACCPVLPTAGPSGLFAAYHAYLTAKRATANRERTVAFDEERLAIVKDRLGDVLLSTITRETIEGFQAKRKLDGVSNRTVNTDVGALRKVLKRYGHWRRLQDHVTMLSEAEGEPIGRTLTPEEQKRLLETAAKNPEWSTSTARRSSRRTRRCAASR